MSPKASFQFILKKTSKQGRIYYFTGSLVLRSNDQGETVLQADTALFEDDAHRFIKFDGADQWANMLNLYGIAGADWVVDRLPEDADTRARVAVEGGQD